LKDKEKVGGAAGVFNMPTALSSIVKVFEEEASLDNLEAFLSLNGARFYGLPPNPETITLNKAAAAITIAETIHVCEDAVKVFHSCEPLFWKVTNGLRPTKGR
jgi:dihydroorotase